MASTTINISGFLRFLRVSRLEVTELGRSGLGPLVGLQLRCGLRLQDRTVCFYSGHSHGQHVGPSGGWEAQFLSV